MILDVLSKYASLADLPKYILSKETHRSSFKSYFQQRCPEIYADIESLYTNPNCTCAAKVKEFATNNPEKISKVIFEYFAQYDETSLDLLIQEYEKTRPINLSGKVLKTTLSEWSNFYQDIKNHTFRTFSVVKEEDVVYVFFL